MTSQVLQMSRQDISRLISTEVSPSLTEDELIRFNACLASTTTVWVGMVDGKFLCTWGLIPPTLLSDQAYLWLYTTDAIRDHEFIFVRKSQLVMEQMLERHKMIVGYAQAGADRSIRWLKWLGAVFGDPVGDLIPFVIRKKAND